MIFYEVNGPLARRIVLYDFDADGMGTWGRMARSLEDCFAWQVTAAQLGGFEVRMFGDEPTLVRLGISSDEQRFLRFLDRVRPAIQAGGGTPAFFGAYDTDASWFAWATYQPGTVIVAVQPKVDRVGILASWARTRSCAASFAGVKLEFERSEILRARSLG